MGLLAEFKTFAMRGNVVDLSTGVIIGAAFGKIVGALVDNVLMPPLGLIIGGVDFSDLKLVIQAATADTAEVAIGYGLFLNATIQFIIVAFAIFLLIKAINKLSAPPAAAEAAEPPAQEKLLAEIRDLLKQR